MPKSSNEPFLELDRRTLASAALALGLTGGTAIAQQQPATPAFRATGKAVWTYEDVALLLIDYQKPMFDAVRSETSADLIELNVRFLIKNANAFGIPVVLSTVGVEMGVNGPTRPAILEELPGINVIDRSSMNAWEDAAFRASVERTGRKRLIIGALWTEICLVYPAISAMKDGYEVMFVVDAVGGTSQVAHKTGLDRLVQAGAIPNTTRATIDEWFRDWKSPQAVKYRDISKWYRDAVRADVVP